MKSKIFILLFSLVYMQDEFIITIPATSYSEWVYFSIDSNSVIVVDEPQNSFEWDLAFQRKHIRTNSGLSGPGEGGAIVDSVGTLDSGSYTWIDEWGNLNEIPDYGNAIEWLTDISLNDFYDLSTHTFVEGIKNPALNAWGWFDETYYLNPTNYVMFVKAANGEDVIKFWAYDYYENNAGGNVSFRYQTGITLNDQIECSNQLGDINEDQLINVVDVVVLVNYILNQDAYNDCELIASDLNNDGQINVVDVVNLVSIILG